MAKKKKKFTISRSDLDPSTEGMFRSTISPESCEIAPQPHKPSPDRKVEVEVPSTPEDAPPAATTPEPAPPPKPTLKKKKLLPRKKPAKATEKIDPRETVRLSLPSARQPKATAAADKPKPQQAIPPEPKEPQKVATPAPVESPPAKPVQAEEKSPAQAPAAPGKAGEPAEKAAADATKGSFPIEVVVDIVKNLCLAFSDITLYAYDHPLVAKQITQTWEHLRETIDTYGSISLSMADGKLFFEGMALEEKNPTVRKLSHHFEDLQVTSLTFTEEITEPELPAFFEVFSMDRAAVDEAGGLDKLFEQHSIKNVHLNSATYRLIHEDEKVVAADSVVMSRHSVPMSHGQIENEIVRYFIDALVERIGDSEMLVNRMKNDPEGLAEQVEKVLHYDDAELEKVQFEDLMERMMANIQASAAAIAHADGPSDDPDVQAEMMKALVSAQGELQRRKEGIASSGAITFVRRMTDLIAAYSDSARAESTIREFVEQEHAQEAVQEMLSDITADADALGRLLQKVKSIMNEHELDSDQFIERVETALSGDPAPDVKQELADKSKLIEELTEKVGKLEDGLAQGREGIKKLKRACIEMKEQREELEKEAEKRLQKKVSEKDREIAEALEDFDDQLATANGMLSESEDVRLRVEEICSKLRAGIVVFDREGRVVTSLNTEDVPFLQTANIPPPELVDALRDFTRDSVVVCENIQIFEVLRDDEGYLSSFLFLPSEDNTLAGRSQRAVIDILDDLGNDEEDFDKLIGDLGDRHPVRKGEAAGGLVNTDPTDSLDAEPAAKAIKPALPKARPTATQAFPAVKPPNRPNLKDLPDLTPVTKIVIPPPNASLLEEEEEGEKEDKDPSKTPTVTLKRKMLPGIDSDPPSE